MTRRLLTTAALLAVTLAASTEARAQINFYSTNFTFAPTSITINVDQVTYLSRNGSAAYVRVRSTSGAVYNVNFPAPNSLLSYQVRNPLSEGMSNLMLDMVDLAYDRPNDFQLRLKDIHIWQVGSTKIYIAHQKTDVKLTVKNPGTDSWSLVSVEFNDDPNAYYYGTVTMVRSSSNNNFHLLKRPMDVWEHDDVTGWVLVRLQPMPLDFSPRTGVLDLFDWLTRTPYGVRIRDYHRVYGSSTDRVVHFGSWW